MSAMIQLEGLTKTFVGNVAAVSSVTMQVRQGEMLSLLGPSGCGKTTTLRMIAGFEQPSGGQIRIAGRDVTGVPVERRGLGMVFQTYALFPHLTVFENVAFGLRLRRRDTAQIKEAVQTALGRVGLDGFDSRMPRQLSGGQQQRVSLARALVVEPSVLLLDEPLSNLDLKLREQLRDEIRMIQRATGLTALYVTHDQGEAMAMSDRVAVMRAGRIEQIGPPREIYERPATTFVARFIGQSNLLDGEVDPATRLFRSRAGVSFRVEKVPERAGPWSLSIRPESLRPTSDSAASPDEAVFVGQVVDAVYLGDHAQLAAIVGAPDGAAGNDRLIARWRVTRGQPIPAPGERIELAVSPLDCVLVERTDI